jgi:DNA-binding NarL/FixJ family response regulator
MTLPNLTRPFRVLLAEDHTLVRAGIRSLLESIPGLEVVGEADDGQTALRMIEQQPPDLVIMDIAMPGMSGLEAASKISETFPSVKVLILSMHNNEEFVLKALKSGAAGYLLKDASILELKFAIEAIARGEIYLSPAVSRQVVSSYVDRVNGRPDPLSVLTPRQRQVLALIVQGFTTKEIAKELNISLSSAETHRTRLMERLDIHDIAGLVCFALQNGLGPLDPRAV